MSGQFPWGRFLFKTALCTGVTIYVYKNFVPGPEQIEKSRSSHGKDYSAHMNDQARYIELSKQGYSYQTITRIIAKEKKERIQKHIAAAKEEEVAKIAQEQNSQVEKDGISQSVESAASTLLGK